MGTNQQIDKINDAIADIEAIESSLLLPDMQLVSELYDKGTDGATTTHIKALDKTLAWKKDFLYCFTGHPNMGKSEMLMSLALIRAKVEGAKIALWTPEMLGAINQQVNSYEVYEHLAFMLLGRHSNKIFCDHYNCPRASKKEFLETVEWLRQHIFVLNPKDRRYKGIVANLKYWDDKHDFTMFLLDPFKNIKHESSERWDLYLEDLLNEFKILSIEREAPTCFIAHPKAARGGEYRDKKTKQYVLADHHLLSGGSAWNNTCDCIASVHRPNLHLDFTDPAVELHTLKMRKQHLTARTGVMSGITYDFKKGRFWFENENPLFPGEMGGGAFVQTELEDYYETARANRDYEQFNNVPDEQAPF